MNKIKNKNTTIETYFDNNSKGFDSPLYVIFPNLNINVEVYYTQSDQNKLDRIESAIKETVRCFQNLSYLEQNNSEKKLKIYVFDDLEDYRYFGHKFSLGLGNEGGKAYLRGGKGKEAFAEMYVYRAGEVHNLKHELAHGLTFVVTEGKEIPSVLMEGIADYLEYLSSENININTIEGLSIDKTKIIENLSLNNILELGSSKNVVDNISVYKVGHALIIYFRDKNENIIKEYLKAVREDHVIAAKQILESNYDQDNFKTWLFQNDTETAMKKINALRVKKGEFIATKKNIWNGEIKDVSYFKAIIEKIDGRNVGRFSVTSHYSTGNTLRIENKATHDFIDMSKRYNFMKVVDRKDEEKLVYCDKYGDIYPNSREYINQVATISAKYDNNVKEILERLDDIELKKRDIQNEYNNVIKQYHSNKANLEQVHNAYDQYMQKDIEYQQQEMKFERKKEIIIKDLSNNRAKGIVEELTYFDPSLVRSTDATNSIAFERNKIYSLQSNGASEAKQINGISIYDSKNKKGELLTDCGYFMGVEGSLEYTFYFVDDLMGLYSKFENFVYVAVTKEKGQFITSFIDGRSVSKDEYYDNLHLHRNVMLKPSIYHISKVDDSLLLEEIDILDHSESEVAKKAVNITVKRGKLLDDKGTVRREDDVYEAKIEDNFLYTFQTRGFYIHTGGDFFIHDHGKNIRYQLPKEITHLKLIEKDGIKKLVPVTKYGDDNPSGMPSNMKDEYKYIDPIFAHKYQKRDHSSKHVNIGLINFDIYKLDTMFAMKYDPNDYRIPQDKDGNAVLLNNQSYFTKVKLFNDLGEEIGMLSNNFHKYIGQIFFSVDYNYSYVDYFASAYPQVTIKKLKDGNKVITFSRGEGDIVGVDTGYTDHERIHIKGVDSHFDTDQMQGEQPVTRDTLIQSKQSTGDSGTRKKEEEEDINIKDDNGQTQLHRDIISGNTKEAKLLINNGANLNTHDDYYRLDKTLVYYKTPLHYAVELENVELVQYLLKHGANPNIENAYGRAPLYDAVYAGNLEIIQTLLAHNADVNFKGKGKGFNKSLLVVAVELGNVEIMKLLIKKGINLDVKNISNQTCLHYAIDLGHTEVAKFLIELDSGINTRDLRSGSFPLHFATMKKEMEIVKYLIAHNVDINTIDSSGSTPLHLAIDSNDLEMVKCLINNDANIDNKDINGWTPLARAVKYGFTDIAEYLVNNNANVHIKSNGLTLLQCAKYGININSLTIVDYNRKYHDRRELFKKIKKWEKKSKSKWS